MKLYSNIIGEEGIPMLILHGLFGMGDNWKTHGKRFAEENGFQVHLIDLRNHGRSPHTEEFSYTAMAEDVKEYCDNHKLENIILLGHSMGGKTAMHIAVRYPDLLKGLIVVDIAPIHYPPHHQTILKGLNSLYNDELSSTRVADLDGLGAKTRVLDAAKTGGVEIANMREWWAGMVNDALKAAESTARVDHRRKSVVAAEAAAEAAAMDQQAKDIAALISKPANVAELVAGFGSAARAFRNGGWPAMTANAEHVEKLRDGAKERRDKAKKLTAHPPAKHDGPQLTNYKRAMKDTWAQEARDEEARIAAIEARERDRAAKEAVEAERVRKEQESVLRAARNAEVQKEYERLKVARDNNLAEGTLPLIKRARLDPKFAARCTELGIDLHQSNHAAARDPVWRFREDHYNAKTAYEDLKAEAASIDRKAAKEAAEARWEEKQRPTYKPAPDTQPKPQAPRKKPNNSGPDI